MVFWWTSIVDCPNFGNWSEHIACYPQGFYPTWLVLPRDHPSNIGAPATWSNTNRWGCSHANSKCCDTATHKRKHEFPVQKSAKNVCVMTGFVKGKSLKIPPPWNPQTTCITCQKKVSYAVPEKNMPAGNVARNNPTSGDWQANWPYVTSLCFCLP